MKKRTVSPETVKAISTLLVALIFMIIVLLILNLYTKKILKDAENEYFASIQTVLDSYAKIISVQMKDYRNALHAFNVDDVFDSEDENQIRQFLKKYDDMRHEDFLSIYFLNKKGKAFFSDGKIIQMTPEHHKGLVGETDFYISNYSPIPESHENSFYIEETVYLPDESILGVLGASVSIENFMAETIGFKIGEKDSFMLLDRKGVFLVHPNREIIGRTYTPQDTKFNNTSTDNLAKAEDSFFISQADDGTVIYLMTKKLPESDWTLSIKIPMWEMENIYKEQRTIEVKIIIFSILIITTLVLIEGWVVNFIQKKQLIATVYDPLTNLWTRERFETEAARLIKFSPHAKFMLIEADIRGFKFINQNYGEEAADKVILYYSKVLNKMTADYKSIMGRGFADHFYTLMKITSVHKAMNMFRERMNELTESLKSYEIPFFPKFGISFLMPGDRRRDITIQGLIGQASFAKSTIKDNMLTQYSVYNSKLLEKINEERFIEGHMQQALDQKEFFVMYQPKIALSNEQVVGAEALVRWNSPKLGLMTPEKFIPLFERNGFITKLDFFVYEEVFRFIQNCLYKGEKMVPISVNMSRNHNKPEKFMHEFLESFNKYSIPAELIQVEILERSVMDSNTLRDITEKLHKEGFSVAMDDFGSGESSLNMLTKIPVDVLKFDREFLDSSTNKDGEIDQKSAKFIHILIDLSKNLEKQTVFEGVETQAQRDFLRSINCDQAQGFFYSKPLSEQDFMQFMKLHS